MKDNAEFVAHYTSLRVACEHILPEGRIRFSPLAELNDPRENKERMIGVGWSGKEMPPTNARVVAADELKKAYREHSKVFCGTVDGENPHHLTTKRCYGRPRMWAQYGENHRGICLLFDRDLLDNAIREVVRGDAALYKGRVEYDDYLKRVSAAVCDLDYDRVSEAGIEVAVKEQVDKYHLALFLRKDSDWIGESEYRWIIHRRELGYEFVRFGDALKSVVLGVDFPDVFVPSIREVVKETPVHHLEWDAEREDFYLRSLATDGALGSLEA